MMIIIITIIIMKYVLRANLSYIPELGALYREKKERKKRKKKKKKARRVQQQ